VTAPVAVYSPSGAVGGVEQVARNAYAALVDTDSGARLHLGPRDIVVSRRPTAAWMALTWKTQSLVAASHPWLRGPCLLWLHGAELTRDGSLPHRHLRERALRSSDVLLAVSPMAERLLPRHARARLQLVGPPVEPADVPRRDELKQRDGNELRLLSVGRAVPRKGHDTAIEVACSLSADRAVRLDVVGAGPDLDRLRARAQQVGRPGLRIEVLGAVPADVRNQFYADADVLLFLPRHDEGEFEGLGLVVLEAAAFGCPAVVLNCGGSRFGVAEGQTGLVLDADAPVEAIADAVGALTGCARTRASARAYAARFSLAAWQQRVRAISEGARPNWQWPANA
jgi:glycosyltransferase involved in cell wall biosynthesis